MLVRIRIRIPGSLPLTSGSGSGSSSGSDSFIDFKDETKKYFFNIITSPQAHHLQSKKLNFLLKFCVKMFFCRHYFSPLNTFMRTRKDPDPDLYIWLGSGSGFPTMFKSVKSWLLCRKWWPSAWTQLTTPFSPGPWTKPSDSGTSGRLSYPILVFFCGYTLTYSDSSKKRLTLCHLQRREVKVQMHENLCW
jgi:hypothetical protein